MKIDYNKMNVKQLTQHKARIETALDAARDKERASLKLAIENIASEAGFTTAELFGKAPRKKWARKPAKHMNPKDKHQSAQS